MDAITYSCCNKSYSMEVEDHWGLDSVIHLTQKSVAVVHARNTAQLSESKMNAVARAQWTFQIFILYKNIYAARASIQFMGQQMSSPDSLSGYSLRLFPAHTYS